MSSVAKEILRCDCSATLMVLRGEPAARTICHCHACRDVYGSPMLASTAWHPRQLAHMGNASALLDYAHPVHDMRRFHCKRCGELVHGFNRQGMIIVPNARIARNHRALPSRFAPTMHLFYAQRDIDVADALPKYLLDQDGPLYSPTQASELA